MSESGREARCFICARLYRTAAMYKLDAWDATYYMCGPCVDVLREHARLWQEREQRGERACDRCGQVATCVHIDGEGFVCQDCLDEPLADVEGGRLP
jgi:hypothetical protein